MIETVTLGDRKDIHRGLMMEGTGHCYRDGGAESNAVEGQPAGAGKWALHTEDVCIVLS